MKLLVTGSEGSLMQSVIPYLIKKRYEVRGVDNFFRHGIIRRMRGYEFIEGDLTERDFARDVTRGVDAIIQGAARIFGVTGFHKIPADILAHDTTLHQNLLWGAKDNGIRRFVYISSSMVYERCKTVPSCEDDTNSMEVPRTDYGLTKLVGERLCQAFHTQYGLPFTIWRPFNIITPDEKSEGDPGISHVFADFVQRIVVDRERPMRILGDGNQVRCFTWIGDVARAIAEHLTTPESENEIFNLGNPRPVTMKDLARMIFDRSLRNGLIGDRRPLELLHMRVFDDDVRIRIPAIEKASSRLGWKPEVSLERALDLCLEGCTQEFWPALGGKQ